MSRERTYVAGRRASANPIAIVEAYRPGALVIVSLWDEELYGLCDKVGGNPRGSSSQARVPAGFEWCFVE